MAAARTQTVLRNDRNHVGRTDEVQSSDIESSSVTDESDIDIITKNKHSSLHNSTRYCV